MTAQQTEQGTAVGRILRDVHHGVHVLSDDTPESKEKARSYPDHVVARVAMPNEEASGAEISTPFGYLFPVLADQFPAHHLPGDHAAVTAALTALGKAVVETAPANPAGDSTIPAVYTYWGQFIDHDITANTDRNSTVSDVTTEIIVPLLPDSVVDQLRNLREPALNLDSVYGDGPTLADAPQTDAAEMYNGIKLRVGRVASRKFNGELVPGQRIPMIDDEKRDLPRDGFAAVVGDSRNDENLIVAQFHVAILRFHNAVLAWLKQHAPHAENDRARFDRARDLVRWHYQWLVVHDYLKTVAIPEVVDDVLNNGTKHFPTEDGETFMPLEFSVAAYRFGHSMVRGAYDYNRNFGAQEGTAAPLIPRAPFGLLFTFTGGAKSPFNGETTVLPFNWVIEWDRFIDKDDPDRSRFARKIDTQLAPPLLEMVNQHSDDPLTPERIQRILEHLAVRNLLRGYRLAIPTGQAVATAMGVAVLTAAELQQGNSADLNAALNAGGFLAATPLWFYILKEAEVRANGNSLGEVGSRIVAETLIGQLMRDPSSYLNQVGGWTPAQGVRLPNNDPIVRIKDLFRFAGVLPSGS